MVTTKIGSCVSALFNKTENQQKVYSVEDTNKAFEQVMAEMSLSNRVPISERIVNWLDY